MFGQARTDRGSREPRLSVPGQLRLALGGSIIVLAAILAVAFYVPYTLNKRADERYVEDAIPLNALVQDLVTQMATGEAAVNAYLVTHDRRSLARYERAYHAANSDLSQMKLHLARHPTLRRPVENAVIGIAALDGLLDLQVLAVQNEEAPRSNPRERVAEVAAAFERVNGTAEAMLAQSKRFVAEAQDEQQSTYRELLVTLGWLGVMGLAIGTVLFILTPRRLGELYAAERRLRKEAEQRADAARALAHVTDGVLLTDRSGDVRFWNPAAAKLLELDEQEALGRRLPDLVPSWSAPSGEANGANGPVVFPFGTGAGERWLSITSVRFTEGVVYAIRDVTEERTLESMRSDFLATASHELRTPMTSIYGAARTLLARDGDLTDERREAFLEMIASESERLARIVDGILMASRLDAGEVALETEQCDAAALARSVLESAGIRAPETVSLTFGAPADLPRLSCDPNRVRQVLLNLVDNAIKYSPDGGEVSLAIEANGETMRFVVRDQGLGFSPEESERIFERFFRLDPALQLGIGGTGLGLYISRELVERMGGRIWADSEPGHGSAFSVELPLTPAET